MWLFNQQGGSARYQAALLFANRVFQHVVEFLSVVGTPKVPNCRRVGPARKWSEMAKGSMLMRLEFMARERAMAGGFFRPVGSFTSKWQKILKGNRQSRSFTGDVTTFL